MDITHRDCCGITRSEAKVTHPHVMLGLGKPQLLSSSRETSWRLAILQQTPETQQREEKSHEVPASCTRALSAVLPKPGMSHLVHPSARSHLVLGHRFLPEALQRELNYSGKVDFCCFFFFSLMLLHFILLQCLFNLRAWSDRVYVFGRLLNSNSLFPSSSCSVPRLSEGDIPGAVL